MARLAQGGTIRYAPSKAASRAAHAWLKAEFDQWGSTPLHRLVSVEFYNELNNGKLDSNMHVIKSNPSQFKGEDCLLLLRYYEKHNDMHKNYDRYANIWRLHSELGPNGSIFSIFKKKPHSGGRTIRKSRHIGRTRRRRRT